MLCSPVVTTGWRMEWPLWVTQMHSYLPQVPPFLVVPGPLTDSHQLPRIGIHVQNLRTKGSKNVSLVLHSWPTALQHWSRFTSPASSPAHSELYAFAIRRWFESPENSLSFLPCNAFHPLLSSGKPHWAFKSQFRYQLLQQVLPDA